MALPPPLPPPSRELALPGFQLGHGSDVAARTGVTVILCPEGALAAVRIAREQRIPFLGTCGGFQYALLEYARDVCGLAEVENAEVTPDASQYLIVPLECSLTGHEEAVMIVPGTLAAKISGPGRRTERC